MNKIEKPTTQQNHHHQPNSGVSKFDRYKRQDDDDEMEEGNFDCTEYLVVFLNIDAKPSNVPTVCFRRCANRNAKVGAMHSEQDAAKIEANS